MLTIENMQVIENELKYIDTRENGNILLKNYLKNKNEAEQFAKFMHVFILKHNKIYIINKIVEATVGARLRSKAIRNMLY
jgi:hypothetical protein